MILKIAFEFFKDFAGINSEISNGCDILNEKSKDELITKITTSI